MAKEREMKGFGSLSFYYDWSSPPQSFCAVSTRFEDFRKNAKPNGIETDWIWSTCYNNPLV